jgi:hypothetical protein
MKYLVSASHGPSFTSHEEEKAVLQNVILPSFDIFLKLEKEKKILGGGLPIGDRGFLFIIEAESNDELDKFLRGLPLWAGLEWEVIALQS